MILLNKQYEKWASKLDFLSKYRKVKISTHWIDLEIPKTNKKLIEALGLHIT